MKNKYGKNQQLEDLKRYYNKIYTHLLNNPCSKGSEREIKKTNLAIFEKITEMIDKGEDAEIVRVHAKYLHQHQKSFLIKRANKLKK